MIPPTLQLLVVGLNHRTAPLTVRESLAFGADLAHKVLGDFATRFPGTEAVILSTCNRVEIYVARPADAQPSYETLKEFLANTHQLPVEDFQSHLYHHQDRHMVEHLFGVASSLDSMVIGETQILSQVKQAYQLACDAGTVGKVFHALFQRALAAAKDVHESTDLAAGRLSIASVAVDLAQSIFDRFDDKTVLCIGAGEMAGLMLARLKNLSPSRILLANRSAARAQELAAEVGGTAASLEELSDLMVQADIVLTSTGSDKPIITAESFKKLLKARRYRPIVIVDIAVPRDVEPEVGKLRNVYLYNIDDLEEVTAVNRDKRHEQIASSRRLLGGHVDAFTRWFAARDVGPLVKALYEQCHAVAQAELEQTLAKHPEYDAVQRQEMERLAHRLVGKILHAPVSQMTRQAETAVHPLLTAALKQLFALQEGPSKTSHVENNTTLHIDAELDTPTTSDEAKPAQNP